MKNFLYATVLVAYLCFDAVVAGQQPSVSNRPADVHVTFSDSKTYKGSYIGKAVARVCGQIEPIYFGKRKLSFEYPMDMPPGDAIEDVTFYSDEMVDGKKVSGAFYIPVNVKSKEMGHPAAWVVDTTEPRDKSSGEATLAGNGPELTLAVKAKNSLGEKLDLLVSCHPPKK